MNITDVRIRMSTKEGVIKAIASITLDSDFVVHDIKVIDGKNGMFVAMPSRCFDVGNFKDIAHPLTKEARTQLEDAVLNKYNEALHEEKEEAAE